jgi:repressor LexA
MPITTRQRQVYDYLWRYVDANKQAPTIAEIGSHFGLSSPSTVHHILTGLEREGLIRRVPNISRGIELIADEAHQQDAEIPLLGVVAAGQPIEAILNNETVFVPRDMVGKGRTYALKVRGDSMIGDHICDGDLIIVQSRQVAENGQTVVALIDGSDATVKKFFKGRDHVRLEPANPRYKPIIVKPADRLNIQGIVVGIIRKHA